MTPVLEADKQIFQSRSHSFMGIRMDALTQSEVVGLMAETIESGQSRIIGNHNMHSLYMWYHEPKMREFFALADCSYIDGMAMILLGRIVGLPLKREHRAAYLDFLPSLMSEAAQGKWRVYFLGSEPGVGELAASRLKEQYPGLNIRTHHGHFDANEWSTENQSVLSDINAYAPHLLMVGMGMPRQEIWILENRNKIHANVISSTGAIMDYVAGVKRIAPRWLGQICLEWLFRLISEPTRLSRRYIVEPCFVLLQMARHYLTNNRDAVSLEATRHE